MAEVARAVAEGDLTRGITTDKADSVAASLESMRERLRALVSVADESAREVVNAASEIAMGNNDLSERTQELASHVQSFRENLEQLMQSIRGESQVAHEADELARTASGVSKAGGDIVGQVVERMNDISGSSDRIGEIISVINSIAFQTNILALNAAVEAARAGEQGRGFAVVATEVRALAGRSSKASQEIAQLINESTSNVQGGRDLVGRAGETMHEIVLEFERVSSLVSRITSATESQTGEIDSMSASMTGTRGGGGGRFVEPARAGGTAGGVGGRVPVLISSWPFPTSAGAPMAGHRPDLAGILLEAGAVRPCETLQHWLSRWGATLREHAGAGPFAAAVSAALAADRMAWAFFSGYQGALQALFADGRVTDRPASFCANESGRRITGIETRLVGHGDGMRLHGAKSWLIAGLPEMTLYVLARAADGPSSGPGSLRAVVVDGSAPGVAFEPPRPQTVIPELPHCGVLFDDVAVPGSRVLTGDGYADFAKPFRFAEDVFITACALAALLGQAHTHGFPASWRERCLAAIVLLGECARRPFGEPATELLAGGADAFASAVLTDGETILAACDPAAAARWRRDASLRDLGRSARSRRTEQARHAAGWRESVSGRA